MTLQQRNEFIERFLTEHCKKVMNTKGVEYSRSEEDVNSNFKRVGNSLNIDPIKVCYIYASKHWDAISNFVKTGDIYSEAIEGRIGDMINYLFILASMLEEQKDGYGGIYKTPISASEIDKISDIWQENNLKSPGNVQAVVTRNITIVNGHHFNVTEATLNNKDTKRQYVCRNCGIFALDGDIVEVCKNKTDNLPSIKSKFHLWTRYNSGLNYLKEPIFQCVQCHHLSNDAFLNLIECKS